MRNNSSKYVVLAALIVSVVALSLGFAAMTSTLTINSSATVTGDPTNFNVSLSKANNAVTVGSVTPTVTGTPSPTGQNATIDTNGTTISGLKATFTGKGQTVKYSFYAYNAGQFLAYLNSVSFGTKTCTAVSGTNQTYVNAACNGISLSVKIGSATFGATNTSISSHTLATGTAETVEVTISYASDAQVADGDFNVTFGDVTILYGSAD